MAKLLAWGDALFLVRYELGKLQIQRINVDSEEKKVSLCLCNVNDISEEAALPVGARLVAAKDLEDTELATRYPVLIFRASQGIETQLTTDSHPTTRKRRRSTKNKEADDKMKESTVSRSGDRLYFYILYETENDNEVGFRLLNVLEFPTRGEISEEVDAVDGNPLHSKSLQIFLVDGPHVLLFERYSQLATVLKLQRATQGAGEYGFYVWREQVEVVNDVEDDASASFELVSCAYVSETHSSKPHLLIHAQRLPRSFSANSDRHTWSILDLDYEGRNETSKEASSQCHYLHSTTGCSAVLSMREQVTCCCFVSELSEWDFTASATSAAFTSSDNGPSTRSYRPDVRVATLVVTGTTTNTIYVHANGILLVSYVLPTRPAEMWCLCENIMDQRHVLCVHCDDESHSFFMLGFSSNAQNVSMELLLSFNHVGHAYTGNFAGIHTDHASTPCQVLLLNDVPGIIDASINRGANEVGVDKSLDDKQLVKRSVLVTQKAAAPETKLSCHRLRLREEKKGKHGPRSRKRSRNDEKSNSKEAPAGSTQEPFHYIERTQKASSRDRSANHFDKETHDPADILAASQSQLCKLADSLSTRLGNGLQELERLLMIVGDKDLLARQLNQLIARQCQIQQARAIRSNEHSIVMPLFSPQEIDDLGSKPKGLVNMETIVNAPPRVPRNVAETMEHLPDVSMGDLKLEQQVSLERFRVLKYVPSSSLVHAEVVLKNLSDSILSDCFVVLTTPTGVPAPGWKCSCSVVPEFFPATNTADPTAGKTRFQLELQFAPKFSFLRERKPLEVTSWLHWGASQHELLSEMTLDWRPSESACAVASVKIYADDVLKVGREFLSSGGGDWCQGSSSKEQDQLLFISSGSNLRPWFGRPNFGMSMSGDSVIRPTFALVTFETRSRELTLYELSKMVANLPPDVYVMYNPLQQTYLRAMQRVLRSMHQEILSNQQQTSVVAKEKLVGEYGIQAKQRKQTRKAKNYDPASIYRLMQRDTDLQASQLLQGLQKRVNFHTMWFDGTTE